MQSERTFKEFFGAIATVVLVSGLCYPFAPVIGYRSVALILLMAVSVLAMRLHLPAVFAAAASSALIWDYFFIPPTFTFLVNSGEDALMLLMYFVVALLNGIFQHRMRQVEQLRQQQAERETSLRLYNTLFNALSHELRTPIATIIGATDMLQDDTDKLSAKNRDALLSEISDASLRLNQQVENLLNVSRLESGVIKPKLEWCDVEELLYSASQKSSKALSGHQVDIQVPAHFPLAKLDFGLMEQALYNLLDNAAKYTPEGSRIQVSAIYRTDHVGHFVAQDQIASIVTAQDEVTHILEIVVADNGKGFPEGEAAYLFDKFYRLKNTKTGGSGLGLFVAKGFVEAHQGDISAHNRPEGGAKFVIEIPTPIFHTTVHHE